MDYLAVMRAFVKTVELGSLTKAAQDLDTKVSTISRHIAGLEAELGIALLNRSTRRIQLTEAGRELLARARSIIDDVDDALNTTSALNSRPQGVLRISLPGAFGRLHVIPSMAAFIAAHPRINVDLSITDERVDLIEDGIDVAIRVGLLPDSSLRAKRLATHRRVLCASPLLTARTPEVAHPGDLHSVPCVGPSAPSDRRWYFDSPEERGHVDVSGPFRVDDLQGLRQAAVDGIGVAMLPSWLVRSDLDADLLVELLPAWRFSNQSNFDQAVWAIYPPKKVVSPKVRAFIEHMQKHLAALPE